MLEPYSDCDRFASDTWATREDSGRISMPSRMALLASEIDRAWLLEACCTAVELRCPTTSTVYLSASSWCSSVHLVQARSMRAFSYPNLAGSLGRCWNLYATYGRFCPELERSLVMITGKEALGVLCAVALLLCGIIGPVLLWKDSCLKRGGEFISPESGVLECRLP